MPVTRVCRPGTWRALLSLLASTVARMSLTSVDLPDPETPVIETRQPSGNATSTSCRLCSRAPTTPTWRDRSIGRRISGIGICSRPREVGPGERLGALLEALDRAGVDDPSAVLAGAGADVDHPVRGADGVLVVLDDDEGVAEVAQPRQRVDQPAVVALVEPDRRLVEDVEHADQARPDLRGQPDALRLATGQRRRRPRQRQVVEPDVEQEAQAGVDLLEHRPGDDLLAAAELEALHELGAVGHRERTDLGDRAVAQALVPQRHREDLRLEPRPAARRARHVAHVALVALAGAVGLGLVEPALEERHDALERRVVRALAAVAVAVAHVHLVVRAVQHGLLHPRRELAPRRVHAEADLLGERGEQPGEVLGGLADGPGRDGAVGERELVVGHQQLRVDLLLDAQAGARGARAVGRVEGEGAGLEVVHLELVAVRAGHPLGEAALAVRVVLGEVDELEDDDALAETQPGLDRVGEALLGARLHRQAVDHDRDVVLLLLLQRRRLGQRMDRAVDQHAGVALPLELAEQVDVLALAAADDRREHLEAPARLHVEHLVDDLLGRLLRDDLAARRAVRRAGAGVEQPQVVVDLGDGADRGARVAAASTSGRSTPRARGPR